MGEELTVSEFLDIDDVMMDFHDEELADDSSVTKKLHYVEGLKAWFLVSTLHKYKKAIMTPEEYVKIYNDESLGKDVHASFIDSKMSIVTIDSQSDVSEKAIPDSGIFEFIYHNEYGTGLRLINEPNSDLFLELDDTQTKQVSDDITVFFSKKAEYEKLGLLHKRGILLYGPPATGKTTLIKQTVKDFKNKARILLVPQRISIFSISQFKDVLEDQFSIVVFEEVATAITDDGLADFLNFLDGVYSWNNTLILASTNYPEKLPTNLVDRPSRFDKLYKVGFPSPEARRKYLEHFLGKEQVTDKVLSQTDGLSIAYLKEIVTERLLWDKTIEEVLKAIAARKVEIKAQFESGEQDELGHRRKRPGLL